jgi:hypothetical protein
MKQILLITALCALFTGCASNKLTQSDPVNSPHKTAAEKYAPWVVYSIAEKNKTVYLALPSSKKEVDKGVYKIWTNSRDPNWENITMLEVVDCNSNESMLLKMVSHKDEKKTSLNFEDSIFKKQQPNSIGQGLINFDCR